MKLPEEISILFCRLLLVALLSVWFFVPLKAQTNIYGKVETPSGSPLTSATVAVLSVEDSLFTRSTATDSTGAFSIRVTEGHGNQYILRITYVGYKEFLTTLQTQPKKDVDLGIVQLSKTSLQLDEVMVTADREAVINKGDTIQFDVGIYKMSDKARVRDLLSRIPGIEISNDGSITSNGQAVTTIYINGKEMFGGNINEIIRNMPASALKSIQLMDAATMNERFTGTQALGNGKALNFELHDEYDRITFGNIALGSDLGKRYAGSLSATGLKDENQITATANANNINNLNANDIFTLPDEQVPGESQSNQAGISFLKKLSKGFTASGNLAGTANQNTLVTTTTLETFLPGGSALRTDVREEESKTISIPATLGLQYADSSNTFKLDANANLTKSNWLTKAERQAYTPFGALALQGERDAKSENNLSSTGAILFLGHRFKKSRRSVTLSSRYETLRNESLENSNNETQYGSQEIERDQRENSINNGNVNYSANISYYEPLGKKAMISVAYGYSEREALLRSTTLIKTDSTTTDVRKDINSRFIAQYGSLEFLLRSKKSQYTAGLRAQESGLKRQMPDAGFLERKYRNLLPYAQVSWMLTERTRLKLNYLSAVREPSGNEIQPLQALADPLNTYLPNPGLTSETSHESRISLSHNSRRGLVFLTNASTRQTTNAIITATQVDPNQKRSVQFVNFGTSRQNNLHLSLSFPIKKVYSQLKFSPTYQNTRENALQNGVAAATRINTYSINAGYVFNHGGNLDLELSNFTSLSLLSTDRGQNERLLYQVRTVKATVQFFRRVSVKGLWNIVALKNSSTNATTTIPVLNGSIGVLFPKSKRFELRLSGFNLLETKRNANQLISSTYVEQTTYNSFFRSYYLLSIVMDLGKQP